MERLAGLLLIPPDSTELGVALFYTRLLLFQQKAFPRGAVTYQKSKIHKLFKAFSDVRKYQFWLPSDRSQNAKVQGGAFCRTSPAKLKIRTFQRPHLGASISFGSLYVRVLRCLQISNLRRRWVGSGWSISSGLLFIKNRCF